MHTSRKEPSVLKELGCIPYNRETYKGYSAKHLVIDVIPLVLPRISYLPPSESFSRRPGTPSKRFSSSGGGGALVVVYACFFQDVGERGVEFEGGSSNDHNRQNRRNSRNRDGCLLVLYFVGQATGGQVALPNRQNRQN